jgi:hypothetical protein
MKNSETLCCHGYTPILFLSVLGKKHPNFTAFSNEKSDKLRGSVDLEGMVSSQTDFTVGKQHLLSSNRLI